MKKLMLYAAIVLACFLFSSCATARCKQDCCSHHGGIAKCGKTKVVCDDGKVLSCGCPKSPDSTSSKTTTKSKTKSKKGKSEKFFVF
jgi:hypothetical protein